MAYYINNLNQKIAYKYIKGKSPGIIFIHGMNSDMQGEKALSIQKYAKKKHIETSVSCQTTTFALFWDVSVSKNRLENGKQKKLKGTPLQH